MSGRQSLAGAFAPSLPVRGAALQGLLAPKRRGSGTQTPETAPAPNAPEASPEAPVRDPIQTPNVEQAPPEVGERDRVEPGQVQEPAGEPTQVPEDAPRQLARKAAPEQKSAVKASETVPGALRNVGVYLPPALLADVKDAVYQARSTYADLLIDSFEAVDDAQIAAQFTAETTLTSSGMPRRAPRKRGEAGIQIQLRLDGMQVAWLDEKVTEFEAPSRSALVSAVFKLHVQAGQTVGE